MKKKLIIAFVVTAVVYIALDRTGMLPASFRTASSVPQTVDLSASANITETTPFSGSAVALPTTKPASISSPAIRVKQIPWNATMGFLFAVGGTQTTEGSLMAKHGINVKLERMDDVEKMKAEQLLFATNLSQGQPHPSTGSHFVIIMGDGGAQYVSSLNQALEKAELGPEYRAEIVGAVGYSRGEDACFGPQEWKDDPSRAKGGVIAAYLRDGDWNLCQYWLANSGIKNNPDETTYDPEAMNWVSTDCPS